MAGRIDRVNRGPGAGLCRGGGRPTRPGGGGGHIPRRSRPDRERWPGSDPAGGRATLQLGGNVRVQDRPLHRRPGGPDPSGCGGDRRRGARMYAWGPAKGRRFQGLELGLPLLPFGERSVPIGSGPWCLSSPLARAYTRSASTSASTAAPCRFEASASGRSRRSRSSRRTTCRIRRWPAGCWNWRAGWWRRRPGR